MHRWDTGWTPVRRHRGQRPAPGSLGARRCRMPWEEGSIMSQRREFVALAQQEGANRRARCRAFGISPTTGYRWLRRYQAHGPAGLQERSRKPHRSPQRTATALEQRVLQLRAAHPAWGGRKLRRRLQRNASIAPSGPKSCATGPSPISRPVKPTLRPGARSTTVSAPMKRLGTSPRSVATSPVHARSPRRCPRLSTRPARWGGGCKPRARLRCMASITLWDGPFGAIRWPYSRCGRPRW